MRLYWPPMSQRLIRKKLCAEEKKKKKRGKTAIKTIHPSKQKDRELPAFGPAGRYFLLRPRRDLGHPGKGNKDRRHISQTKRKVDQIPRVGQKRKQKGIRVSKLGLGAGRRCKNPQRPRCLEKRVGRNPSSGTCLGKYQESHRMGTFRRPRKVGTKNKRYRTLGGGWET